MRHKGLWVLILCVVGALLGAFVGHVLGYGVLAGMFVGAWVGGLPFVRWPSRQEWTQGWVEAFLDSLSEIGRQ